MLELTGRIKKFQAYLSVNFDIKKLDKIFILILNSLLLYSL
jgi:hypothetical protein